MTQLETPIASREWHGVRDLARRRPITVLLVTLLVPVYVAYAVVLATGLPFLVGQLVHIVLMIAVPALVSAWAGGRPAVRRVYAGLFRWRIGGYWLLALFALPMISISIALATGTVGATSGGWAHAGLAYALLLVGGAVTANLWEETVWSSFVQSRLMARHGLLTGSLLTAIPFVVIHLPLAFQNGLGATSAKDAVLTWALMIVMAPFLRYLIGMLLMDTGGSTLAAGVLHASMNASMALTVLAGGWQPLPALAALTLALAAGRARCGRPATVRRRAPRLAIDRQEQEVLSIDPDGPTNRSFALLLGSADGQAMFRGNWALFVLAVTSFAFNTALGEELLFRGLLLPRMRGAFGRGDRVVNAILFGLYHLHQPWSMPSAVITGLVQAYATRRWRSAWLGIIAHSAQSVFTVILLKLVVS
jgi:membrane protease YdiL (CAAX protease family)